MVVSIYHGIASVVVYLTRKGNEPKRMYRKRAHRSELIKIKRRYDTQPFIHFRKKINIGMLRIYFQAFLISKKEAPCE